MPGGRGQRLSAARGKAQARRPRPRGSQVGGVQQAGAGGVGGGDAVGTGPLPTHLAVLPSLSLSLSNNLLVMARLGPGPAQRW